MHIRIFRTYSFFPYWLALLACCAFGFSPARPAFGQAQANTQASGIAAHPVPFPIRSIPRSLRPAVATSSATTTTLTLSASAVNAGTAVTLTAHVVSGSTAIAPGILLFCDAAYATCAGPAVLASAVLNSQGSAARSLMLPAGTYSIVASFQGTTPYAASSSAPMSLTVEGYSNYTTKATLTSATGSKGVYAVGASLTSHSLTAPTGSLVFTDATHNRTLGSVALPATALGGYQPFGLISTGSKSGPNDLAMGDFNGDGIPDLVVPDSATGVVAVFLGKGDGTFAAAVNYSTGSGSKPLEVVTGDFNADGKLDLAVALGNQAAVAVLMGVGDGTFQAARTVTTASSALYYPVALTVADFNHDGRLDIATANSSVGASALLGNGDGTFQTYKSLGSSKGPTWIAAGDFNNDGKPDLAVTTSANTIDISLGNGDGSFATYTSISTGTGTVPESVVAADLDGDDNLDLVVACYGANAVGVLLGNGDGTFLPIELYAAGSGAIAVTTTDLNLDGIPDLVVTDLTGNGISLFEGNGDGTFMPLPGYSTTSGSEPAASVVADLNADGTPEIVSALYGSSALYVLQTGRIQGAVLKDVSLSTTGTINLTAAYAGDSLYAASTSAAYAFTGSATTAAAPAFSPVAGTYTAAQTVTLSSTTSGAKIYYTLDGTTPTTASSLYSTALAMKSSMTVSAIAVATGYTTSSVAKAAYVIENPAATPTFSPGAGKYIGTQSVTLTSTTSGATIYYTVNGATPTTSSVKYTGPISVTSSTTIEAIATASQSTTSAVASAAYVIQTTAVAPTFSLAGGTYIAAQTVTLSSTTTGAKIYYTLDGTTPTTASSLYSSALAIKSSETVSAIAVATGYTNSSVAKAAYVIQLPAAAPTFSPAAGTYTAAQILKLSSTASGAKIYYTLDGSAATTASSLYSTALAIKSSMTVSAIAVATGYTTSSVAKAAYVIETPAAAPTFAPIAGKYTGTQSVTLTSTTSGATIYYTVNGSTPTTASSKYTAPIAVSSSMTIKAMATASQSTNSAIASAVYTITQPTLALASSVSAPKANQSLQLTATLTAPGATNLAGTWTVFDGKTQLCTASQATQATYACTAELAHGTHALSASYMGKTNGWTLTAGLSLAVN